MGLKHLTDRIVYYPYQPETDRPMLSCVCGSNITLAVDAGNSAAHVDEFYSALDAAKVKRPDFTAITHWHWDHTFGMHHINGLSIAHNRTNIYLARELEHLYEPGYADFLKKDDACLNREYGNNKEIVVTLSSIQFDTELTLNLGGVTAEIFHVESPHSEDTVLINVPEEKTLFLGDATSEDFYNNGYMDRRKLKKLIQTIEQTDCQYCILSHCEPLYKADLLQYLDSVVRSIEKPHRSKENHRDHLER